MKHLTIIFFETTLKNTITFPSSKDDSICILPLEY